MSFQPAVIPSGTDRNILEFSRPPARPFFRSRPLGVVTHGSITLDPEQCALAGIYPLEFVNIWNKNSGQRISTYVIYGEAGSRCCILNGAAARTCQQGDELIISAVEYVNGPKDIYARKPVVLTFDAGNAVLERLRYVVGGEESGEFTFNVVEEPM